MVVRKLLLLLEKIIVQTVLFISFLKDTRCFPTGHALSFEISKILRS